MSEKIKEIVSLACRAFLVAVLLRACIGKIWDPTAFSQSMAVYNIMPMWAVNAASAMLAWFELWLALSLLLGFWLRVGAGWTAWTMAFFTGLMIYVGVVGLVIHDCGCFPGVESEAGYADALRDFIFFVPALWLTIYPGTWLTLDAWLAKRRPPKPPASDTCVTA
ncbi:MAG: DoxX family protein [Deltaproteobacteria bacterium]|nr:DoxX family protein [Deltaproteobacteria bacterium]